MPFGTAVQSRLILSVTVGRRCFGVLGDPSISSPIIHMRRHDLRIWKAFEVYDGNSWAIEGERGQWICIYNSKSEDLVNV